MHFQLFLVGFSIYLSFNFPRPECGVLVFLAHRHSSQLVLPALLPLPFRTQHSQHSAAQHSTA